MARRLPKTTAGKVRRPQPAALAAAWPDRDRAALRTGAEQLGLVLTETQILALMEFGQLLARWNRVHNLTAIRADERILTHHLLDSLALVRPLLARAAQRLGSSPRVLDVGAGGGLPGIPLAIACPQLPITLIDAVRKKAAFLTQAVLHLGLSNVSVIHGRVEGLTGAFDIIASRAFASLSDFVSLTAHLLAPGGIWLAMKGRADPAEIDRLPPTLEVTAVRPLSVPGLDGARHLVEIQRT